MKTVKDKIEELKAEFSAVGTKLNAISWKRIENSMRSFSIEVAKKSLENAADNFTIDDLEVSEGGQIYYDTISHNIQDKTNIPSI